jgi:hypothetical protein
MKRPKPKRKFSLVVLAPPIDTSDRLGKISLFYHREAQRCAEIAPISLAVFCRGGARSLAALRRATLLAARFCKPLGLDVRVTENHGVGGSIPLLGTKLT